MHRTLISLGSPAAAGMLALTVPRSAHAAEGVLIINGQVYENSSGCYAASDSATVTDDTDTHAEILSDSHCTQGPVGTVHGGDQQFVAPGSGVRIS